MPGWRALWVLALLGFLAGFAVGFEQEYSPFTGYYYTRVWDRVEWDKVVSKALAGLVVGIGAGLVGCAATRTLRYRPGWVLLGLGAGIGAWIGIAFIVLAVGPRSRNPRWDEMLASAGLFAFLTTFVFVLGVAIGEGWRRARSERAKRWRELTAQGTTLQQEIEPGLTRVDLARAAVSSLAVSSLALIPVMMGFDDWGLAGFIGTITPFAVGRLQARVMIGVTILLAAFVGFAAFQARRPPTDRLPGTQRVVTAACGFFMGAVGLPLWATYLFANW